MVTQKYATAVWPVYAPWKVIAHTPGKAANSAVVRKVSGPRIPS